MMKLFFFKRFEPKIWRERHTLIRKQIVNKLNGTYCPQFVDMTIGVIMSIFLIHHQFINEVYLFEDTATDETAVL